MREFGGNVRIPVLFWIQQSFQTSLIIYTGRLVNISSATSVTFSFTFYVLSAQNILRQVWGGWGLNHQYNKLKCSQTVEAHILHRVLKSLCTPDSLVEKPIPVFWRAGGHKLLHKVAQILAEIRSGYAKKMTNMPYPNKGHICICSSHLEDKERQNASRATWE